MAKSKKQDGVFNLGNNVKKESQIMNNDIRRINLEVTALFKWSDKIVDAIDSDEDNITYRSGFVMHILPTPQVYDNKTPTLFIGSCYDSPVDDIKDLTDKHIINQLAKALLDAQHLLSDMRKIDNIDPDVADQHRWIMAQAALRIS